MLGDVWGVGVKSRTSPERAGEVPCKWDCQGIYKEFASKLCPNLPHTILRLNGCPNLPKRFQRTPIEAKWLPKSLPKDSKGPPK